MTTRWTDPQRAAIEHVRGDLLVSAAAGSGKTAVLAERCARLVCETDEREGGCGVEGLLVLTFTEAAATEMRGRIAEAIREKLNEIVKDGMGNAKRGGPAVGKGEKREGRDSGTGLSTDQWHPGFGERNTKLGNVRWLRRQAAMVDRASISTLHGFCARVLRQHFHAAQIDPSFEVIDEDEARLMRDDALTDVLARWHLKNRPAAGEAEVSAFAAFMEDYAQGRESTCRDMMLRVYRMLASTADPAAYAAGARELYSPEGRGKTVDRFVRGVIVGQLRLLGLTARRAVEEVEARLAPG